MSKGAQILAAERLLGRFEAFSIGDKHEVRGEHATVEPVDFSASPYAADHANVVPDDFRLDVRDEEFLQTECFVVRRSHRTPPALFLSPERQSCVGILTERKLNLAAHTPKDSGCGLGTSCNRYSVPSQGETARAVDNVAPGPAAARASFYRRAAA